MMSGKFSMTRPIDSLGRIVIPKEMRKVLGWQESDQVFIGVQDGTVYMRKFSDICPICRNPYNDEKGLNICGNCISKFVSGSQN
ncbi:MAG TPA: AbrB family transcriptional regulator [Ruminococcaceae bacterium]|jgi:transcriptional pleiotropic regulator of transition state genes|nr:AbrB family transcriptional regulator [Oscillospiraceae bacterium]